MRITNPTMTRNYSKSLNVNQKRLYDLNMRITSRRKFDTMAEDTASGVRAMKVRRSLAQIDYYTDNCETTKSVFDLAEKSLMQISSMCTTISEGFIAAISDDKEPSDREIFATQMEKLRDEILTLMNNNASGRFLFGGTNTKSLPFTVDADSDLCYNNVKVKDIDKSDPQYAYLFEDAAYVDIGLGLTMQKGDPQSVIGNTAFENTLVGIDFLGAGPENLYIRISEMIDILRNMDPDPDLSKHTDAGKLLDRFRASHENVVTQLTRLGSDAQYLEFTIERLDNEKINLTERHDELETIDPYEAIMNYEMQYSIFNAALAMGQKLLQPTLFNFMN